MKILLDTHTFIWWDSEIDKLSQVALDLCKDPTNTLFLSAASVWEMQIKLQLGKLKVKILLTELIETQVHTNNLEILPIRLAIFMLWRVYLTTTKIHLIVSLLHKQILKGYCC